MKPMPPISCTKQARTTFSSMPALTACRALCSRWFAGPNRYLKKSIKVGLSGILGRRGSSPISMCLPGLAASSARHAVRAGMDEKVVLACLVHDIGVIGFIRADHGYWGAQMVAPYVDEEVSWAIRAHQALRFYADESVGYSYPESYIKNFGADYRPDPYIEEEYKRARDHKWYMTARMITVHDIYSFEPDVVVELEEVTDIIGRNFMQPKEGLGWDSSPSAHMWRTLIRPTRYL